MEQDNKAGNQAATASADAGNNAGATASPDPRISQLEAEVAKERKDKEIYKAGMLAMKKPKKLTAEDAADPEKLNAHIADKVDEALTEKQLTDKAAHEAAEIESMRKRNEELERALESRQASTGGAGGGAGASANSPDPKPTSYFSDEQKAELRRMYEARGFYTKEQIDQMVVRAEQIAKTNAQTNAMTNPGKVRTH